MVCLLNLRVSEGGWKYTEMTCSDGFLEPFWRVLPICTTGPRLGLGRLKWVFWEVGWDPVILGGFHVSAGRS